MNIFKKTLCLLLCLLSVATPLVGCSSGDDKANSGAEVTTAAGDVLDGEETTAEETTAAIKANVPESDFGGYNFRVLVREASQEKKMYNNFVSEGENGDVINDAIFKRQVNLEDSLGIKLSQIIRDDSANYANKTIFANDEEFDMMQIIQGELYTLGTQKALVNFHDIPYLDLDADWWNRAMKDELTINDKLYYLIGDISLSDDVSNFCIFFNKKMWEENRLDDPYAMVKDGTWTFDKLGKLSAGINADTNGDGVHDHLDVWGLQSEEAAGNYIYFGSGDHMVTNTGSELEVTLGSERSIAIIDEVLELLCSGEVLIGDQLKIDEPWAYIGTMFQENRLMMRTSTFEPILDLRNMEADFGVVPIPKYEESQEGYHAGANQWMVAIGVPVTASDIERTGIIMESMAVESLTTTKPAFYEVSLQGKVLRDNDSEEMLELIFNNQVFDVGHLFNIAGFRDILGNMIKAKSNTIASTIESVRTRAEKELATVLENYAD